MTYANASAPTVATVYQFTARAKINSSTSFVQLPVQPRVTVTSGLPTSLAFAVEPSTTVADAHVAPAPAVRIDDAYGNLTNSATALTIALGSNPGGGTLAGTTTVAASSGVATFADLSINKPAVGYTLAATSSGLNGATSSTFDVIAQSWSTTGNLADARASHTATLLSNGEVLVAGGGTSSNTLNTAELFNPSTGTWSRTGAMLAARTGHTATLLPSGKVLVAGGVSYATSVAMSSAELYDPATGVWSATGSMAVTRYYHTATLLPDGKVLVVGGAGGGYSAYAELYDPGTGTWSTTGMSTVFRVFHTATLLANGEVLIAGGTGPGSYPLASAELYDPGTGTWSGTGALSVARYDHSATLLPSGKVLVAGGDSGASLPTPPELRSAELYDPATATWSVTGSMASGRIYHAATLLSGGQVLVAGGSQGTGASQRILGSSELYDPSSGLWSPAADMADARYVHTATLLPNGKVLVAGGASDAGILVSAELFG